MDNVTDYIRYVFSAISAIFDESHQEQSPPTKTVFTDDCIILGTEDYSVEEIVEPFYIEGKTISEEE